MRFLIIAAAALLAVAAPGVASAQTGGSVGIMFASLDDDNDSAKDSAWAINGIVLSEMDSAWSLQLRGLSIDMDHGSHGDGFSNVEAGANYQIAENISVGAFVGQANLIGSSYLTYGVAGRVDFGRFDIGASIAGADAVNGGADDLSNVALEGGIALMEGLRLAVHGSWSDFDSIDAESYGAGLSYHIPNTNVMIGGFYRNTDYDSGETEAFGVSIALHFGDRTRRPLMGSEHLTYDAVGSCC